MICPKVMESFINHQPSTINFFKSLDAHAACSKLLRFSPGRTCGTAFASFEGRPALT
jgi:hypothetical protein